MSVTTFQSISDSVEYCYYGAGQSMRAGHGVTSGYDQSEILVKTVLHQNYRVIAVSCPGYLGTPLFNRVR